MTSKTDFRLPVPYFKETRGSLCEIDFSNHLPFEPKRTFCVMDVPPGERRGEHSVSCEEALFALSGQCKLTVKFEHGLEEIILKAGDPGLYLPRDTWIALEDFAPGTVLLVYASETYADTVYTRSPEPQVAAETVKLVQQADPAAKFRAVRPQILKAWNHLLGNGPYILNKEGERFEESFASYIGSKFAVGVNSATAGLTLALKAFGIGRGDTVLTVSMTAPGTVTGILNSGATVKFVDVDLESRCMDPDLLTDALTQTTKAIVPVHLHGHPAAMHDIMDFANKHQLIVIEDCAQAHGATIDGQKVGSFGHASVFSFYPTKNLSCPGDGGAVATSDEKVDRTLRDLRRNTALTDPVGNNSRLDELQAAVLNLMLPDLDDHNLLRRQAADQYNQALSDLPIVLPAVFDGHVFHQYAIRLNNRDMVQVKLREKGIQTGIHFQKPVHAYPKFGGHTIDLPNTSRLADTMLSLPIQPELMDHQGKVIGAIRETLEDAL